MSGSAYINARRKFVYNELYNAIIVDNPEKLVNTIIGDLSSIATGDRTKWISSVIYYPFRVNRTSGLKRQLVLGKDPVTKQQYQYKDVVVYEIDENKSGYFMGQTYIPHDNGFIDFEPYTSYQVYLPYFGVIDLPAVDILNKWVQFRLYIDFKTGQAQYVVGVTDTEVYYNNSLFNGLIYVTGQGDVIEVDDENTRVIYKTSFQIGTVIPFSSTNFSDAIRNTVFGAIKGATQIAATCVGIATGNFAPSIQAVSQVATNETTYYERNKNTNRLRQEGKVTQVKSVERPIVTSKDNTGQAKQKVISDTFNLASLALQSSSISGSIGASNNVNLEFWSPESIFVFIKRKKVKDIDSRYRHLYGVPLGEVKTLANLRGYTEISEFNIEVDPQQYSNPITPPTQAEMELISNILHNGVIL